MGTTSRHGLANSGDTGAVYFEYRGSIGEIHTFDDHKVLYRSDSKRALSVVSKRYQVVQPREVLEFYRDLTEVAGFNLESAGVLKGGKKFWALAKTGQAASLKGSDISILLPRELHMIKSELIHALSEKFPELQIRDVELAVNCMLNQMADALVHGERIEIRDFGSFDLHHRPSRIGCNPRTGEAVDLPAKVKVHFKPGKEMRDRVNAARDQ